MKIIVKVLVLSVVFFYSCKKFEYDPNQAITADTDRDLTASNINKLLSSQGDSVVTIALIGDSHTHYESSEKVVSILNQRSDVDLIVHTGDFTDHGYISEFEKGVSYYKKLNKPFFVVIGNHDLLANGIYAYKTMFGPTNFSFVYQGVRFVFFNSNGREYGFEGKIPDIPWMKNEIQQEGEKIVLVSHVPFFDVDYDPQLVEPYKEILNTNYDDKRILIALSGHQHNPYEAFHSSMQIPHIGAGSTKKQNFYIIKIQKDTVVYEKNSY